MNNLLVPCTSQNINIHLSLHSSNLVCKIDITQYFWPTEVLVAQLTTYTSELCAEYCRYQIEDGN